MEKKRKREKAAPNGASADVHNSGHVQDSKEFEHHHKDASELAPAAAPLPLQALHPWHAAAAAAAAAAAHAHHQQSGPAHHHQQEGAAAGHRVPYCWPYGDFQHPPRPFYPLPPGSASSEWSPAAGTTTQGNAQPPAGAPPYFAAGPWFSPPFGAPYPAFFGYPMPANPALQKGVIKPPQGLSQKHQKLWEMQSAENVQLWATLARVEAELGAQRSKVAQLETDLQALKAATARHDNPTPADSTLASPPAAVQAAPRRGRYKKTVIGNIPPEAIAPRPRGRKPAADKAAPAKKVAEKGRAAAAAAAAAVKAEGNAAAGNASPATVKAMICNRENGIHDNGAKPMNFGAESEKLSNFVSHSDMISPNWATQANGSASQEEDDEDMLFQ